MVSEQATPLAGSELFDPVAYGRDGYPYEAFRRLRREAPVHWYEGYDPLPFWALTRRAEIAEVARQPLRFSSVRRFHIVAGADYGQDPREPEVITQMDPPKHGQRRGLVNRRFTPRALRPLAESVHAITHGVLDELEAQASEAECDFVESVAAPLAIAVIAHLMDLPRKDWPRLYRWTNEMTGPADPDVRREGESAEDTRLRATAELFEYFAELASQARVAGRDDLVSDLARARIDGAPLPNRELLSYYLLLVAGGNETTRNALSGGLLAFFEHPEQWRRLRADAGLVAPACEEILRWTTPVIHNARTASEDCQIGDVKISTGETLVLFWPSANRDEDVFEQPDRFRIDRRPNPHVAFGIGEHFCLGAHLARLELRSALQALAERCELLEQAGPVERLQSSSVGGVKRLPIRYRFGRPRR